MGSARLIHESSTMAIHRINSVKGRTLVCLIILFVAIVVIRTFKKNDAMRSLVIHISRIS